MTINNYKFGKEEFILFFPIIFLTLGIPHAIKVIFVSQIILIFLCLEFKINKIKFFFSTIIIFFLIYFTKNYDSIKFYIIFLIIIFSLEYYEKKENKINGKILYSYLAILTFIIFYKLAPHNKNFQVIYLLEFNKNIKKEVYDIYNDNLNIENLENSEKVVGFSNIIPALCDNDFEKATYENKFCTKKLSYLQTRFTINNVDVNFISIVLLTIILLSLISIPQNKLNFYIYLILSIFILFFTKSRAGLAFFLFSLLILYFNQLKTYKIILLYLLLHFFIIYFGYVLVNSVEDPMSMKSPRQSLNPLIDIPFPTSWTLKYNLFRLFSIFDPSNFIRFSGYFEAFLIYINDYKIIIFPDHGNLVRETTYLNINNKIFNVTKFEYHPHNLFMTLIKEVGLIVSVYFHILIFDMLKSQKFKILITPLIFSSIFLGHAAIYLFPTVLLFSFKISKINLFKLFK